jgi:hypothetical protein
MKIFADNTDGTKGDIVYKMLDGEWAGNSYTCDQSEVLFSGDEEEVEEEGDSKDEEKEEKDEDEGRDEKEKEEDGKKEDEGDEEEEEEDEGEQKSRRAGRPEPMEEDVSITNLPSTSASSPCPASQQPLPQTPAPVSPLVMSPDHTDSDDLMEDCAKCSSPIIPIVLETPVPPDIRGDISPEYAVPPSPSMYAETVTSLPPSLSITPTPQPLSPTCGAPSERVFETY